MRGSRRIRVSIAAAASLVSALAIPGSSAAQPAESAFLYMGSQRGEYIGQGSEWRYTQENTRFAADSGGRNAPDPSSISIDIDQTADGHGPWDVELGAPRGRTLTPGRYLDAQDNHIRAPGLPGIRVDGDGRGCGRIDGRFVVREATFTAAGDVIRFRASFVQYCVGYLTALYGVVGIGVPPPVSFPKPPATVLASISLRSDPGDFVGQGQAAKYSNLANALFRVGRGSSGSIFVRSFGYDGSVWSVDLAAPGQRLPRPGPTRERGDTPSSRRARPVSMSEETGAAATCCRAGSSSTTRGMAREPWSGASEPGSSSTVRAPPLPSGAKYGWRFRRPP